LLNPFQTKDLNIKKGKP